MTRDTKRGIVTPLVIGLVAAALTVVYGLFEPKRVAVAYVAAYGFGVATVLGALVLLMVFHVTGALWWRALRRVLISVAGTTPIFILLFLPIAATLALAYPWHSPVPAELDEHLRETLHHQRAWNNPGFFLARSFLYLGAWTLLTAYLRKADAMHLADPSPEVVRRERQISAVGLLVVAFTLTFASFDWLMSLQPGWSSSIFGLYVFTSGLGSALSVVAIASHLGVRTGLLPAGIGPDHFGAIGRLMLMAVILWTYIGFFQLMLVWIANLPHEVGFYWARSIGSWNVANWVLFLGKFVIPFFLLLSRPLKRSPRPLAAVGVWLVLMTAVDFAWIALPSIGVRFSPLDLLPFVAVFSLTWAYGAHLAYTRGRVPERRTEFLVDPALQDALRYRSP